MKYVIIDPYDGIICKTDSEEVAKRYMEDEEAYVIDTKEFTYNNADGTMSPIPTAKEINIEE